MMTLPRFFSLAAGVVTLALLAPAALAKGTPDERRDDIRQMRDTVLADLYKEKPELKARIKKAAGYAAFSNVGVNLLIASFAGGKGIVVDRKGNEIMGLRVIGFQPADKFVPTLDLVLR